MKTLTDYTQEKQTQLLADNGAFFAFSKEQFLESKVDGVKYVSIYGGLISPKENADKLVSGLDQINREGMAQDIKENGIPAIIQRELANHEAQITCDISDTLGAVLGYGITREQVEVEYKIYFKRCIADDCF